MATEQRTTGLTYEDLQRFPDDNLRRELIDGELIVTAAPIPRHQQAVMALAGYLWSWAMEHGGQVYPAPTDVKLTDHDVVEPDVLFVRAENLDRVGPAFIRAAPDIVVEVSSPSTRRLDQSRKRDLYERFGVPEYWFVDLESDRIEVRRLSGEAYGPPLILTRGDTLTSPLLPGFEAPVDAILAE